MGASKEETISKIVKNRMGYGVLEACSEEMKQIKQLMEEHQKDKENIDVIVDSIEQGDCVLSQHDIFKAQVLAAFGHQKIVLLSKKLSAKTKKIQALTPLVLNIPEFNKVLDENDKILAEVEEGLRKIEKLVKLIKKPTMVSGC